MNRRMQENLIAGILLVGFIAVIVMSLGYSPRSRLVPLPMAILGAVLVTFQLIWQNLRSVDELEVDVLSFLTGQNRAASVPIVPNEVATGQAPGPAGPMKNLVAFGMVVALLTAFLVLGPLPAMFLFTATYLALTKYASWPKGLLYAAVFTAVILMTFGYILKIPLDRSILLPEFGQYIGL